MSFSNTLHPLLSTGSILGPSINRLVTDRNTKICFHGFILAHIKVLQPIKLILNNTRDYKNLFLVCIVEILQVIVSKIEA